MEKRNFKKNDFLSIARLYEPYYKNQNRFYHNFKHGLFTVDKGIDMLVALHAHEDLMVVYAHAMGSHDAGHLCGLQKSDADNVVIALGIYNNVNCLDKHLLYKEMGAFIIKGTEVPYVKTPEEIALEYAGNRDDLILAIKVARDVDHLGIIGIEDQIQREVALTGLMREFSRNTTKEQILANYESATNKFFDSIHFYTQPAKDWAKENLAKMHQWQLDYTSEAIENAY